MNKLLLLSRIKGWMFVLKSSINYNIDFIYHKKASELSFSSRLKTFVLMVSKLAFVFKISRPIVFSGVKKVSFAQSRKFSLIKKFFYIQRNSLDQGVFLQSKKFSLINECFHSQKSFPKKILLDQGDFPQAGKISTVKEMFHKIFLLDQGNFPQRNFTWSRKFSTNKKVFQFFKRLYKNLSYLFFKIFFETFFKQTLLKHWNNSSIFLHH